MKCQDCGKNMLLINAITCDKKEIKIKGKWYKRNTTYFDKNDRCHDCGIMNIKGNVHHAGCDMERCPSCKGQLISCGCINFYNLR